MRNELYSYAVESNVLEINNDVFHGRDLPVLAESKNRMHFKFRKKNQNFFNGNVTETQQTGSSAFIFAAIVKNFNV